jgi:hypothetical protein
VRLKVEGAIVGRTFAGKVADDFSIKELDYGKFI